MSDWLVIGWPAFWIAVFAGFLVIELWCIRTGHMTLSRWNWDMAKAWPPKAVSYLTARPSGVLIEIKRPKEYGMPPRGEKHGRAKLSSDQVREMKELYAQGDTTYRELAEIYGVHHVHVGKVIRGEKYLLEESKH